MLVKKLAWIATVLMTASLILLACAPVSAPVVEKEVVVTATPAPETIKISFSTVALREAGNMAEWIPQVIDEYEAAHPNVEVEWIDVPTNIRDWMMSNMAAGALPDVIDTHPAFAYADLAAMGAWVPLDDSVNDN